MYGIPSIKTCNRRRGLEASVLINAGSGMNASLQLMPGVQKPVF